MKHGMSTCLLVLTLGCGVFLAGCSQPGSNVKTVDVSGVVKIDGQPVGNVVVRFASSMNHEGSGMTDDSGHYSLGAGAEPGQNKVSFTVVTDVDDGDEAEDATEVDAVAEPVLDGEKAEEAKKSGAAGVVIPAKYANPETTEMTFTVPDGGTSDANFDLTSE